MTVVPFTSVGTLKGFATRTNRVDEAAELRRYYTAATLARGTLQVKAVEA